VSRGRAGYSRGLHPVGDGLYAYLQPDGSWGWSNAGLVVDGGEALLVDTLFDLELTRAMLREMARLAPRIDTVVNTHANGDHCWGNQLVRGAEIVASRPAAEEMRDLSPRLVAMMVRVARLARRLGPVGRAAGRAAGRLRLGKLAAAVESADFVIDAFGGFDFAGITVTPPSRTFTGRLDLTVGDTAVELIEVGPAHTRGDLIVHVPRAATVFTGDILFVGGHPVVWAGPVSNWIAACERILALDATTVVPGHGPLATAAEVAGLRDYLVWLTAEVRERHAAGLDRFEAALDIAAHPGRYAGLGEIERLVVNTDTLYRELDRSRPERDPVELFAEMSRFRRARAGAPRTHHAARTSCGG